MRKLILLVFLIHFSVTAQNLLIKNTSFEEDMFGWDYGVHGKVKIERPEASFATSGGGSKGNSALQVTISRSFTRSSPKNIYLVQDRVVLKKGKTYRVTFSVKSEVPKDKIYVAAGSGSALTDRRLTAQTLNFTGNNTWQELSYTFVAKNNAKKTVDFKNAAIYFGFNYREGDYFLDDVKVERVKK